MKIILCTTFREFRGNENDKIQYAFLENIRKQTYQDYIVVTTTFGEKNVKSIVDSYFGEKSIVKNIEVPKEYRFSLTDVVLSGIDVSEQYNEASIIVWCTCDIQIEHTFFQKIVDNYKQGFSGIVHPNIIYESINALKLQKGKVGLLSEGIDILFFDSEVLLKARQDIIDYKFYDWGVFEFFLVAISIFHSSSRINLFNHTKIRKIINDRNLTNETQDYFDRCNAINLPILDKYVKEKGLSQNMWDVMCYNAHLSFKMIPFSFLYLYIKAKYILFYTKRGEKLRAKLHITRLLDFFIKEKRVRVRL